LSFCRACWEINCNVCLMTSINGIYLPSTDIALVCMCNRCILYWVIILLHSGKKVQYSHPL
jgi:hypothetical protein